MAEDVPSLRYAECGESGPKLPTNLKVDSKLDVFKLFWSNELEEELLESTRKKELQNGTRIPTKEELHRFLMAGLLMCINVRHDYTQHWSKDAM